MYIIIITSLAVAKFAYCDMQAQQNYTDNVMNRMGAQVHGLGANNPTCTPWRHH